MSYDVKLTDDGDLPFGNDFITGDDLTTQAIAIQLSQGLGEWPLDTSTGLPYEQWIESLPAPLEAIEAKVSSELLRVSGVETLENIEVKFDVPTQTVSVDATIRYVTGTQAQLVGALASDTFDPLGTLWQITLTTQISIY